MDPYRTLLASLKTVQPFLCYRKREVEIYSLCFGFPGTGSRILGISIDAGFLDNCLNVVAILFKIGKIDEKVDSGRHLGILRA